MAPNIQDLALRSPAFRNLETLDQRFTQYGDNIQPPLAVTGVPKGTHELAIICHDPDAPLPWGVTHWTLYGIPADVVEIDEGQGDKQFRPGPSSMGSHGYMGPRPPASHGPHHYFFWVYALNRQVDGTPTRREFLDGYAEAIIEQNRIVGTYEKR